EFVGVAIPEHMSLDETIRLTAALERLKVPVRHLLCNMLVPTEAAQTCAFCRARHKAQRAVLAEFARRFAPACALYVAPQQAHDVRGAERLSAHFAEWHRLIAAKATRNMKARAAAGTKGARRRKQKAAKR